MADATKDIGDPGVFCLSNEQNRKRERRQNMNYDEAMTYIKNVSKTGMKPGLARMRELCRRLGNPEENLSFIHIAGTNGKGAVSAYISSVLAVNGYVAGRYVSPAVFQYEESIRYEDLKGEHYIDRELLARVVTEVARVSTAMEEEGLEPPTVFEMETAMAFLAFCHWHCQIVVLEAGLGGEEDATNIVRNVAVSVITPVSLDHRALLGDTPEEIAEQKAGIIKDGPVVTLQRSPEVLAVLNRRAGQRNVPLTAVEPEKIRVLSADLSGSVFSYGGENFRTSMPGLYQVENACLAVEACRQLPGPFAFSVEQLILGIRMARWRGRFEVVCQRPLIIVDGAHNPAGAQALRESIRTLLTGRKCHGIMGVFADKDYRRMVEILAPCFASAAAIPAPGPRGLPAERLAKTWRDQGCRSVSVEENAQAALRRVMEECGEEDAILIFGSLSILQQLKWR